MPRLHPTLSLTLGLLAAGSLLYAWQLHNQLAASDAALQALKIDLSRLHAKANAAAKPAAAPSESSPGAPHVADAVQPPAGAPESRGMGGADRAAQFAALRDSPEVQALMAIQRKAALDSRYAALFKKLNLSPADLERFKALLADKQATAGDVFSAARAQGLNPRDNRDQIRQMVTTFEAQSDAAIQSALGESVYQQYKQYEQTLPQRTVADQLGQRLSYSTTPLSDAQSEQLINVLAAAAPARDASAQPAFGPPGGGGFFGGRGTAITDQVVAQSQSFLTTPQLDALKALQQEQAAQAQLRQQMRSRMNNGTPPGGASGP